MRQFLLLWKGAADNSGERAQKMAHAAEGGQRILRESFLVLRKDRVGLLLW
jgi:hypothetical protein